MLIPAIGTLDIAVIFDFMLIWRPVGRFEDFELDHWDFNEHLLDECESLKDEDVGGGV